MIAEEEELSQQQRNAGKGSDDGATSLSTSVSEVDKNSTQIWRYLFRSNDAAQMVLKVLMFASTDVQRRAIQVIRMILESNPANGQILSRM